MRDEAVLWHKERNGAVPLKLRRKLDKNEYRDIQRDDEIVHHGRAETRLIVADGKEHGP